MGTKVFHLLHHVRVEQIEADGLGDPKGGDVRHIQW